MKSHFSQKKRKSLGALRTAEETKPRSPDMTGHVTFQGHTFEEIARQYKERGDGEVPCNIAAWMNRDKSGAKYLSVEISPWFVPEKQRSKKADIFDSLFGKEEDD